MAVFFQLVSEIKRGTFTCTVATAAYRSGSKLVLNVLDAKTQIKVSHTFDYSQKKGIAFSKIMAPTDAPEWISDRQILWQAVEDHDEKYNAHLATEFTIALPEELTTEQNIELITEYVQTSFVDRGMIADVNYHNDHNNNPHLHIMCPTRPVHFKKSQPGFLDKEKSWSSKRIRRLLRQEQAQIINKYLKKYGHSSYVSDKPDKIDRFDCLRPWL
jgi:ATP-dependent exoDNAse (exonuclease V) alpha subunit